MDDKVYLLGIIHELSIQNRLISGYFELKGLNKEYIDDVYMSANNDLIDTLKKATGIDPDGLLRKVVGVEEDYYRDIGEQYSGEEEWLS